MDPARSGLNLYAYCKANPLTFADPSGLCPKTRFPNHRDWEKIIRDSAGKSDSKINDIYNEILKEMNNFGDEIWNRPWWADRFNPYNPDAMFYWLAPDYYDKYIEEWDPGLLIYFGHDTNYDDDIFSFPWTKSMNSYPDWFPGSGHRGCPEVGHPIVAKLFKEQWEKKLKKARDKALLRREYINDIKAIVQPF